MIRSLPPPLALRVILALVGLALVAIPTAIVLFAPHAKPLPAVAVAQRVVPKTELPPVEPVELQAVAPEDAKAFNDTVPFSTGPNPAARPFIFSGDNAARARAIDCLAVGVLYEAGDDTEGERAVAQVVLNRVRHPAFPKSVCGVIFQGSERSTGCQFSFACDGAMGRWHPNPAAWARAREVAIAALSGLVYAKVGYATHYHTDWVVPYWSASLDKVTAVKTHLFFRWTGWWGTPAAFVRSVSGFEPGIAALDGFSAAHSGAAATLAEVNPAEIDSATIAGTGGGQQALSIDPNSFLVTLDPRAGPDSFTQVAAKACGTRDYCKLMAWTDKMRTPKGLPLGQAQISTMAFSYLRDKARGYEKALWNCGQFKRATKGECMKLQVLGTPAATLPAPGAKPVTTAAGAVPPAAVNFTLKPVTPDGLGGVRKKESLPKPAATPAPTAKAERP
ncbi:cell wall hydrolase [Sphingomonas bacterium]|uniref:cell wall hydrolase n=1 Tax=Sphingomonas bacterium TaxID=1895847 RepID=UPI0026147B79|nr:cell wall hydrolase [Sphingomonas bacterium]MDB5680061.1 SleB-like protein [Sphingomonas bacterium]